MGIEGRISEMIFEYCKKQDQMLVELTKTNERLDRTSERSGNVGIWMTKIQEELIKLNLQTNEQTRAIAKLADRVEHLVTYHENRIDELESIK